MQAEADQSPPFLKGDLGGFSGSYPKIPPCPPLRKGGNPAFRGVKLTPMREVRDRPPSNIGWARDYRSSLSTSKMPIQC